MVVCNRTLQMEGLTGKNDVLAAGLAVFGSMGQVVLSENAIMHFLCFCSGCNNKLMDRHLGK